jgi:hypothetical protein
MRYTELFESDTSLSYLELLQQYPEIKGDLKDVGEWLKLDPTTARYSLAIEPMSKFEKEARDMLATYDEFPEDDERTHKIVRQLERGAKQLPIFVDTVDNFIMEGRHRIVAFMLEGLVTVPVVSVLI